MTSENVNYFLATNGKYLPAQSIPMLREQLANISDTQFLQLQAIEFRDPTLMLLLSILVCGVDRMFIGQIGLGVLKMLTAGGCGIWWIVDIFLISDATRQYNLSKINETLTYFR